MEARLDVDSALRQMALDNLTVNLDSYIGSGHNYYLYHRKADDRFVMMPWDPNEAWGNFNMGMALDGLTALPLLWLPPAGQAPGPPLPGQPAGPQQPGATRPLAQRLWAVPEFQQRYLRIVKALLEGPAKPETLLERMITLRDLIRPWVEMDTLKMFTTAQFDGAITQQTGAQIGGGPQGPPPPGQIQGPAPAAMLIPALRPFMELRQMSVQLQLAALLAE